MLFKMADALLTIINCNKAKAFVYNNIMRSEQETADAVVTLLLMRHNVFGKMMCCSGRRKVGVMHCVAVRNQV